MIPAINSFFSFFDHKKCKDEIRKVIQLGLDDSQKIVDLNTQILDLLHQIQELKAVNDYQAFKLETEIKELKNKIKTSCRPRRRKKTTSSKAMDGSMVKIVDYRKDGANG